MFADDLILYIENPKDSTRKFLELINEYSKVAGHKINTQKSLAFLYANNEKTEREIRGMGWGGRWEGGSCLGTPVHPWWIHVNVWQNQFKLKKIIINK